MITEIYQKDGVLFLKYPILQLGVDLIKELRADGLKPE